MSTGAVPKKIIRFNQWIDPSFDDALKHGHGAELVVLARDAPDEENWRRLGQADIYHVCAAKDEVPPKWRVTADLIQRCPQLVCVSSSGSGYDTIDVEACTDAGILVMNQAGGNAESVAEHTFGLMLAVSRHIAESDARLRAETGFSREDLMGHEIHGQTLGLVGIGNIGTRVAELGRAFHMEVIACDPYVQCRDIKARGARPVALDELLASSDVVSVHCPLTRETTGLFGARVFRSMKRGALFISTARGGIHDEAALYDALASRHLAGAGLDVWKTEPPPLSHPLLQLRNVVATYHTAGVTYEGRRKVATMAAEQILQVCAGRVPDRIVNKEALPQFLARTRVYHEK